MHCLPSNPLNVGVHYLPSNLTHGSVLPPLKSSVLERATTCHGLLILLHERDERKRYTTTKFWTPKDASPAAIIAELKAGIQFIFHLSLIHLALFSLIYLALL